VVLSEGRESFSLREKVQKRAEKLSPATLILSGFILIILSGTFVLLLPFMVNPGNKLRFIDALFTATSATCVTGLIVVDTATFFFLLGTTGDSRAHSDWRAGVYDLKYYFSLSSPAED